MNESQTRLEKIAPALKRVGWGVVEDSHISVEYPITNGRVSKSVAPRPLKADYVLWYKGVKLAVVEAKSDFSLGIGFDFDLFNANSQKKSGKPKPIESEEKPSFFERFKRNFILIIGDVL
mgnify:CR=1 FL=1